MEKGLSASIYTQVSDVEDEVNGIFTYDRKETKLDMDLSLQIAETLHELFKKTTPISKGRVQAAARST